MKRTNAFLLIFALLTSISSSLLAQDFEGKVVYDIKYIEVPAEMRGMEGMLPQKMEMLIKGAKIAMKQDMMGGKQTILFDGETDKSAIVMDMMGQKMAIMLTAEEEQKARGEMGTPAFTYLKDTKNIAGYKCYKVQMIQGEQEMELWYTKDIKGAVHKDYMELDGFPLEYLTITQGMKLSIVASSVTEQSQDDKSFEVPEGYNKITMAEFTQMMGGQR